MIQRGTIWIILVMGLGLGAGTSHAEPVRIVEGGPRAAKHSAAIKKELGAITPTLAVCWRGERPAEVEVELAVDARGQVTSSRQITAGAAAQCAAGILAVHTLSGTGAAYRLRAALATQAPGAGSIQGALAAHRAALDACHDKSKSRTRAGQVTLRFAIHPDGHIDGAKIPSSTLGDPELERCLISTIQGATLPAGLTAKVVAYSLSLDFAAASGGSSTAAAPAGDPALQPKKEGPLAGSAISKVMNERMPTINACYTRVARSQPTLAGRVVLRFTIQGNGSVQNVKIRETTLNNAKVEGCIVEVGKTLRFPADASGQPTKVFYPISFSPR